MLRHRLRLLGSLAAVVLMVSGCLTVDQQVIVEEDGSGTLTAEVIYSPALVELSKTFGEGLTSEKLVDENRANRDDSNLPAGVEVEVTPVEGNDVGLRVVLTFDNLDQLNEVLSDTGSEDADPSSPETPFTGSVTRDGDRFEFRATPPSREELIEGFGDGSDSDNPFLGDLPEPTYTFSMKLPGRIEETNGKKAGGSVSWDLLAENRPDTLLLTTNVGGGVPWLLVGAVALVLLVALIAAGGTGLLLVRRKSRPSAMVAKTASPVGYIPDPAAANPWGWQPPAGPQANTPPTTPIPVGASSPAQTPDEPGTSAPAAPPADATPVTPTPQTQPAPPEPALPPAGWYPDPQDPAQTRWWDGQQWSS